MHEQLKLNLLQGDLAFNGTSTLPQFKIEKVVFGRQDRPHLLDVQIALQRMFPYHLTNTFLPTIR
jgi:hypothetical protein